MGASASDGTCHPSLRVIADSGSQSLKGKREAHPGVKVGGVGGWCQRLGQDLPAVSVHLRLAGSGWRRGVRVRALLRAPRVVLPDAR